MILSNNNTKQKLQYILVLTIIIYNIININAVNCNYLFDIIHLDEYFNEKIYFKFETNATNYEIEYWIEDPFNDIVKSKLTTTNTNQKQYTPKDNFTNYTIKANLSLENCSIFKSKIVQKLINNSINLNNNYTIINNTNLNLTQNTTINNTINITNLNNTQNITQNNTHINLPVNTCNYYFDINLEENISTDLLKFSFSTNVSSDYEIDYWIEDFLGNIVKSKLTTTNTNKKQYTPKKTTELYYIKSVLKQNNCTLNASKLAIFYTNTVDIDTQKEIESTQTTSKENDKNTYIKITDYDKLKEKGILSYEIYRGDTAKRAIYIYFNSHLIHSFYLEKYSKAVGNLNLNSLENENILTITGLDLEEKYIFNISSNDNKKNNTSNNNLLSLNSTNNDTMEETLIPPNKLYILFPNLINNSINFNLLSTLENSIIYCYVLVDRTQISQVLNISAFTFFEDNITININNSILEEKKKNEENFYNLKLICKYQKIGSSYFNYETYNFNYSVNTNKPNTSNAIQTNFTNSNLTQNTTIDNEKNITNLQERLTSKENTSLNIYQQIPIEEKIYLNQFSNKIIDTKKTSYQTESTNNSANIIYKSKNYKILENSYFSILIGMFSLLSIFILKW